MSLPRFPQYDALDLPSVAKKILDIWEEENTFEQSVAHRQGAQTFTFYEGPPSANGKPGIHHVLSRTIKDLFCRYKTLRGYQVQRKAGWDTHGLPIELAVEKELGITKADIGTRITVEEYNTKCREVVMRYTDLWNEITKKSGYWVDLHHPYVTYENRYIESVWWILKQMHEKDLLYKGYTIQPYSPKAGTGLSSHELNMPGCYKDVKDTSATVQFALVEASISLEEPVYVLAWTTTPWTLPANTALAVGSGIEYSLVQAENQYTGQSQRLIVASALLESVFGDRSYDVLQTFNGSHMLGWRYEPLFDYVQPLADAADVPGYGSVENAFQVISGEFVRTDDGTGIVHIAPTFGADDAQVARDHGVPPLLVRDAQGKAVPIVDVEGRYVEHMGPHAGKYVKHAYYSEDERPEQSLDVELVVELKQRGQLFASQKYEHSYPHCWRTDTPVLYYPLDSWFVKTTALKDRLVELNKTIHWQPSKIGEGRFGTWLENVNDWNLSRSRFWGIPLPIWRTEGDENPELICIGSLEELKRECERAVEAGVMDENPLAAFQPGDFSDENYHLFDLHKPYIDRVTLVASDGRPMKREDDLIDVWFDSGAMPYAQHHYPFEHKELIDSGAVFPADFIAEGVDQTRGWFFTLHVIAAAIMDDVAYKNVLVNGLVLDKHGNKMSKSRGNAADPFEILERYGPDATRWYMISNAQPWENLRFDEEGIKEVQRRFFGTVYNTYSFFALYANIDGFTGNEPVVALQDRPDSDRWILSELHSLIGDVTDLYDRYEPTLATRAIRAFVEDRLSNWYVRLNRRRFWKGQQLTQDKLAAYQTLHTCLEVIAQLMAPVAPFYADRLYRDVRSTMQSDAQNHDAQNHTAQQDADTPHHAQHRARASVHLSDFPVVQTDLIDVSLQERMRVAQTTVSLGLSLRKQAGLNVRQPLANVRVHASSAQRRAHLQEMQQTIIKELNVHALECIEDDDEQLVKSVTPNFKTLGPRYGKQMPAVANAIRALSQDQIRLLEQGDAVEITFEAASEETDGTDGSTHGAGTAMLRPEDVMIASQDIPGWSVAHEGDLVVAIDTTITPELKREGLAREFVNRIQNLRKDQGLQVTDRIVLRVGVQDASIQQALEQHQEHIAAEVLATEFLLLNEVDGVGIEIDGVDLTVHLVRHA